MNLRIPSAQGPARPNIGTKNLKVLKCIAIAACLMMYGSIGLQAQETNTEWNLADFPTVSPGAVPRVGTFWLWSSYGKFGQDVFGPPLPFNPYGTNVTIYGFTNIEANALQFMIDDTPAIQARTEAAAQGQRLLSGPFAMSEDDDSGGMEPMGAVSYPSNALWIELVAVSNATVYVNLHGTEENQTYQLLSRDTLDNTNQWAAEGNPIPGASGQDWTPATVAIGTRTNTLFLWAMSYVDTDGDGLPDWWELQNGLDPNSADTGNTGVPDGYKDLAGDGWTTLYKYEHGVDGKQYLTPPPPRNVAAHAAPDGTNVVITWESGGGPVSYYTVRWGISDIATNAPELLTYTGGNGGWPLFGTPVGPPSYQVRAHFSDGSYSDSAWVSVSKPGLTPEITVAHGPQDRPLLVAGYILPEMATLRMSYDYTDYTTGNDVHAWTDLYPSNFVNGIAPFPAGPSTTLDYAIYIQATGADGSIGDVKSIYDDANYFEVTRMTNYVDEARQTKENLKFLLASATVTRPFSYASDMFYPPGLPSNNYLGNGYNDFMTSNPEMYFARTQSPTSYEYYGFHTYSPWLGYSALQQQRPINEHYLWQNFLYNPVSYTGNNYPTNIHESWGYVNLREVWVPSLYDFSTTNSYPLAFTVAGNAGLLGLRVSDDFSDFFEWSDEYGEVSDAPEFGILGDTNGFYLPTNARNLYGLPIQFVHNGYNFAVTAGGSPNSEPGSLTYIGTDVPDLQVAGYYFASQTPYLNYLPYSWPYGAVNPAPPLPGAPTFSPTNTSPVLIAPIGQSYVVSGWAKMAIANGYSDKFAYLEQYFDKAFKIDTNGAVTSNETGILSPYGEFFPTEPGPVALVTKGDVEYPDQRGTGVVNVIKLQLDVNHDTNMDLSFGGPDNTSQSRPFRFWINDDHDEPAADGQPDRDESTWGNPPPNSPDYSYGQIRCPRNLEDFARLWICGLPSMPTNQGFSVQIGWTQIASGSPRIRLYRTVEEEGGIGYLTDANIAAQQVASNNFSIGEITPSTALSLPLDWFNSGQPCHLLFEAGAVGKGALTLTVTQGTNILAQTSAWLDLQEVYSLFEQAAVVNVQQSWPSMVEQNLTSTFKTLHSPDNDSAETNLAVFVHGWRVPPWEAENFAETMFKRLYWRGYHGKFASLFWPTRSSETDPWLHLDYATYNRSEHIAFGSGTAAAAYLKDLRQRFPDHTISVCAHSMGNVVVMQALKELSAASVAPVDNYVAMQAALPAHCYDPSITNVPALISAEQSLPTPDTYTGYASLVTNALRSGGKIVNFFNPADFALGVWVLNQRFYVPSALAPDTNSPITMKPNTLFGYYTDGANNLLRTNLYNQSAISLLYGGSYLFGQTRTVTEPFEVMPFISRPRSLALGAQAGVQGAVHGGEVDLNSQFGFTGAPSDHSGQWNRNIQDPAVFPFYTELRRQLFP